MNADEHGSGMKDLTDRVIGAAFRVSNTLGCGYLEKVYENALVIELRRSGLAVHPQRPVIIRYEGQVVGEYVADIVVEDMVLLELKACKEFDSVHYAQCLNYLRATGLPVCLLMNFGEPRVKIKRFVNRNGTVEVELTARVPES